MTRIGITSDTHCDHGNKFPQIDDDIDLLILAGDIGDPYITKEYLEKRGKPYIYIAGNHEYYNYYPDTVNSDVFGDDQGCVENKTVIINGHRFHCCCLWTDLSNPIDAILYENNLADTGYIKNWGAARAQVEFNKSIEFLEKSVQEGDIIVTHHAPSFQSVSEKFKGSLINSCFASNLDDMILDLKPSIFIHGHMHDFCDYMIGDTRIICNPMGYPHEDPSGYKIMKIDI